MEKQTMKTAKSMHRRSAQDVALKVFIQQHKNSFSNPVGKLKALVSR